MLVVTDQPALLEAATTPASVKSTDTDREAIFNRLIWPFLCGSADESRHRRRSYIRPAEILLSKVIGPRALQNLDSHANRSPVPGVECLVTWNPVIITHKFY